MKLGPTPISVLCVDDNALVAGALRARVSGERDMSWAGGLESADELVGEACRTHPDVVVLDVDMPGRNVFDAIEELHSRCPEARVIMFSGLVRRDLVDRAIDAGAWGYLTKHDGAEELLSAIRRVAGGDFVLGEDVAPIVWPQRAHHGTAGEG